MVEEEVVALSPPAPLDHHKRKLQDLEVETAQPGDESAAPALKCEEAEDQGEDGSEAKRPRVGGSEPEGLAGENGHQNHKEDETQQNYPQKGAEAFGEEQKNPAKEASNMGNGASIQENTQKVDSQQDDAQNSSSKIEQLESVVKPSEDEPQPVEMPQQAVIEQTLAESGNQTTSRRMEVPNNMVGVLIGKAGDTIRNLQYNSGAKIQITRDADADPGAATRSVELIGTLDSIDKAEKLMKEVIAEADAGGSPSLVARGFTLAVGAMEQIEIQVPNEKVGLIIGKGGETIKNLQTRSGARIQLVPQHLPAGDTSKVRTVRVSGDKKQIDMANGLIKDVMNQNAKPTTLLSNYGQQQAHRPRGPPGAAIAQWGPHGPRSTPSMPYDHQQHHRGPYPSQNQQYPPYGGYPPQAPPRGSFGPGWEHMPPVQGSHGQSGGYDYYGGQGGRFTANAPPLAPHPAHAPSARSSGPAMGHTMHSHAQANYNYAQPPYGAPHGSSQPGSYQNAQGYPNQQQYQPPPYSAPSQGAPAQPYPASQPGAMPYQAPVSVAPSYGQNVPAQQPYPYGSMPATTNDGYSQPQPQPAAVSMPGYPQQVGSQSVVQQQTPGYSQAYGQYPTAQQGYGTQTAPAAGYGYQGQADPSAYAAGTGQSGYAQPATSQAGYDQLVAQQPGGYPAAASSAAAAAAAAAPVGYGNTVSPQPGGYPASQVYGASG